MRYERIGQSKLEISALSFGCWQFERGWSRDYSETDLIAAAHCAIDLGINMFDTAAAYGNGESERLLGRIIRRHRDRIIVSTKVLATSYTPEYLLETVHASCKRLQVDCIDLYHIHWPRKPFTRAMGDDLVASFQKLRDQGKIRYAGVSNFRAKELVNCSFPTDLFIVNQLPYNLLWRTTEDGDLKASVEAGLDILTYSSLAQGYLAGGFHRDDQGPESVRGSLWHSQLEHFDFVMDVIDELNVLASRSGYPLIELAINWLLMKPHVVSVICGARTQRQVEEQVAALRWEPSNQLVQQLDAITLPAKQRFQHCPAMWVTGRPTL